MRRRLAVAALVLGASVAALVTAPPASADSTICRRRYQFVPIELKAHDIEDWWPDTTDEPQLYYPGVLFSSTMRQGDRIVPPQPYVYEVFPGSTFNLELSEVDSGSKRVLGTTVFSAFSSGGTIPFSKAGDYSYGFSYRIDDLGATTACVRYVYVPNVVGWSRSDARYELGKNFSVTERSVENCGAVGKVVAQSPATGERQQWSTVTIDVGTCTSTAYVPNVVGWWASDAIAELQTSFAVAQRSVESCTDPGTVVSQSPKDVQLARGSTVTISVSRCSGWAN